MTKISFGSTIDRPRGFPVTIMSSLALLCCEAFNIEIYTATDKDIYGNHAPHSKLVGADIGSAGDD